MSQVNLERSYAAEMDAADPLRGYRERFALGDPALIYLNGNSLGALPLAVKRRMDSVLREEWGTALARSWDHWVDLPRRAGDLVGELTGAAPGQVIVTDNTTVNLYKLASAALDARPGRPVIVTDDDNFPSDRYVLAGLAQRRGGARLRMISTDINEGISPDAVRAAVGPDTALLSLSHVAYRSGALADMAAITAIAHEAGALVLWDLCHSVGAVPVELDACDVDLAAGCTYKYLNAGPGAPAFLYVAARLQQVLRQPIWGWFSQRDQFAMGPAYDPAEGIAKFTTGTPPILGTAAVEEGARLLTEAGIGPMRAKSTRLTSYLIGLADAWLAPLGCELATPRDSGRRGGHVTFRHPRAEPIVAELAAADIIADYRTPDRFRFGLAPLTTRFTDVWTAVSVTRDLITKAEAHGHGLPRHLLQLPAARSAAFRPAAPVGRARRDAVHRHPPDLRAVVQAAAARVRQAATGTPGGRHHARDAHPAPGACHSQDRRGPARRARDHDAHPVPAVPRLARHLQRVPVRAVPRDRGGARQAGPGDARAVPQGQRGAGAHRGSHVAAVPVRLAGRLPGRPGIPGAFGGARPRRHRAAAGLTRDAAAAEAGL